MDDRELDTVLRVECCWCGADLGEKPGKGQTGVTSGICDRCRDRLESQLQERADRLGRAFARGLVRSLAITAALVAWGLLAAAAWRAWS